MKSILAMVHPFSHRPFTMTLSGLKTVVNSQFFFFSLLFFGVSATPCLAGETIAPGRNISVVQENPLTPEWKILWDKARLHARDGEYDLAAHAYSKLFGIKSNIEEANWEYCKVLLQVEDYITAAKIIDGLLEKNPNRSEYLMAGAAVAYIKKDYTAASHYYGKVFEMDPVGENAEVALEGLANSLRQQGKKEQSFSLLEQLSARDPENSTIIHNLALDARELGKNDKARKLYAILLKNPQVEDRVIFQAAEVFDAPGYDNEASSLWQEYLKRHPEYMPFRKKLADYYIDNGEFDTALQHLTYLADKLEDNQDFLLMAGSVCLNKLNRPDKALVYFERYSKKYPDDREVKKKILSIQSNLAKDFLSIVENGGASLLWNDLAVIEPSRIFIFLKMAELLGQKGKSSELLEVLIVLYKHLPQDDALALRIARQYYGIKKYRSALGYLTKISDRNKNKPYYQLKGKAELNLGLEREGLTSFEQGLSLDPVDLVLRKTCIELAGELGAVENLIVLFDSGKRLDRKRYSYDFVLTYLQQLSFNSLFVESIKINKWAEKYFADTPEIVTRLEMHRAETLRKAGKSRKAEKLLRNLLIEGVLVDDVLARLTENAASDKNIKDAESWFQALLTISDTSGSDFGYDAQGCRLLLLKVKMLGAKGKHESSLAKINKYLETFNNYPISKEMAPLLAQLQKERCWLSFKSGHYQTSLELTEALLEKNPYDPELLSLYRILGKKMKLNWPLYEIGKVLSIGGNPVLSRLLAISDKELLHQEYEAAEKHLKIVLNNYPSSVAGKALWADLSVAKGKLDEGIVTLSQLIHVFPKESDFINKLIEIEVLRGRYQDGIALLKKQVGDGGNIEPLVAKLLSLEDTDTLFILTRLLWGDKQYERSLQLYRQLLTPSVLDLMSERFRQNQLNYLYLTREHTFWNSMMVRLHSKPEIMAELMAPAFLVENRENEAGKIVAEYFEKYSWQKLLNNEYLAKNAIFEKNYYYAEQSYKRLLEEVETTEGLYDLASIYGKIGKYRKEAQVYEAIQNSGVTTPELTDSIERNTLQLSPKSTFDVDYKYQNGRDGYIDMKRLSLGTSFWFTPDLDKDISMMYAHNSYKSDDSDESARSNLFNGSMAYEFAKDYELVVGAGAEKITDDGDIDFLYRVEFSGQLDDYVNAYGIFEKKPVYDTVEAVKEQITYQAIETGLNWETPVGLAFGGGARHRSYSDSNEQNRFHGFASYSVFGESLQFVLRYDYQYLQNTDANATTVSELLGDNSEAPTSYWSPSYYSEHRLNLHFQHDFLGYQQGSKRGISYYAIDTAIGYEDDENISYSGVFNIFLEMNPRFLLKGNFILSKSDVFEEKRLGLSLHYRW